MKVILLRLPPNSTHILQPLDVSLFKPFKTILCRSMDHFMIDEDVSSLTKKQAISLTSSTWQNGVPANPDNLISGFANTGLWPISAPEMLERRELYADGGVTTEAYQETRCGSQCDKSSGRRQSSFPSHQRNAKESVRQLTCLLAS
uniref:AlNc14C390G11270 protein n=1 Tax=Albugo laibachii Nc14 TaxID=890382 RepID=F0WYK7_9STRA|nr:AlNc14C390G11270 [Albugo laibachii Nc14]|eukprot:CCA26565.1 AlNc14C390G11270 [Albugo laibachii Nc14]